MQNIKYGDLIKITKDNRNIVGKFICKRPNGSVIYDHLFAYKDCSSHSSSSYKIQLILSETFSEITKITIKGIDNMYNKLIQNTKDIQSKENETIKQELVCKKKKLEKAISLLQQEIENTKENIKYNEEKKNFKVIDNKMTFEKLSKIWDNKVRTIREKSKGLRKLKRRLNNIENSLKEKEQMHIKYVNKTICDLTNTKKCILNYLINYKLYAGKII